jgi:2-keto-4-pentenoate hydratase/2-oxohepta-3-ene-1,7-dioic acid hydratase in catechol pathway
VRSPVPAPRVIWGVGLNYRDHAAETGRELPSVPTLFVKSPSAVIGNGDAIVVPPMVTKPDYEGELAVVVGRTARDLTLDNALECVAGVTVGHDVSARDHQYNTGQFSWSKSFDTFCPLGPELVTLDEIDLARGVAIETNVNGEVMQSSNTSQLDFSVPELLVWISQGCTLEPGDTILTGTPAGVGAARTPPRWLVDGDVVEITVAGVGTLRNPVVRRSA